MYNRLDFILPWYVDDYADLNAEQEAFLDEQLEPFLVWHRSTELPTYVILLEQIELRLDRTWTEDEVAVVFGEFEQAWFRTENEMLDWALELGAQLSDDQVDGLVEELNEKQLEYEEEYLPRTDEEFRRDSYESMLETGTDYLGRLDGEQRNTLLAASESLMRSDNFWLQERAKFLARLEVLLDRQPGWQQQVKALVDERDSNASPEYHEVLAHNTVVLQQLTADLLNSRTPKQDAHLRKRLTKLRTDLEVLIAEGKEAQSVD
ncbi:MAG: DUF6279 family lipoprotein [Pseudomonadota bacterium]